MDRSTTGLGEAHGAVATCSHGAARTKSVNQPRASARSSDAALLRRWRKTARANDPSNRSARVARVNGSKRRSGIVRRPAGIRIPAPDSASRLVCAEGDQTSGEVVRSMQAGGADICVCHPRRRSNPAVTGLPVVPASADCFGTGCRRSRARTPRRKRVSRGDAATSTPNG